MLMTSLAVWLASAETDTALPIDGRGFAFLTLVAVVWIGWWLLYEGD